VGDVNPNAVHRAVSWSDTGSQVCGKTVPIASEALPQTDEEPNSNFVAKPQSDRIYRITQD